MIRYSIASTTTAATRYFDSEQILTAGVWGRGYGLSGQVAFLHGVVDLDEDRGNLTDCPAHLLDLPILEADLRVWEQQSGRCRCLTVPRED